MTPDPDLEPLLQQKGLIASGQVWQPLPGGRTNRLWRVGDVVVKRFAPQDANPRFPNDPTREAMILHHLQDAGIAPDLLGQTQLNGAAYLIYRHLDGQAWTQNAALVGRLLRQLHEAHAPSGLRQLSGGSSAICTHVEAILPQLPESAGARLLTHRPKGHVPPARTHTLLHGDVVPGNVVVTPQGGRLIDWQCPAIGDPVEDLAIFLSPAMQLIYRGQPLSRAERAAFLTAYDQPEVTARLELMQPWHHWAMAAYCAWKVTHGAADYAPAMELELAALQGGLDQQNQATTDQRPQQGP